MQCFVIVSKLKHKITCLIRTRASFFVGFEAHQSAISDITFGAFVFWFVLETHRAYLLLRRHYSFSFSSDNQKIIVFVMPMNIQRYQINFYFFLILYLLIKIAYNTLKWVIINTIFYKCLNRLILRLLTQGDGQISQLINFLYVTNIIIKINTSKIFNLVEFFC